MKVSLTFALVLAVLGVVDRANAIPQDTLDDWVIKHDLLDLDYKAHFKNRASIPPLTLNARKSFGQNITLKMTLNEKIFEGCQRLDELDDDFFVGTVAGQPKTSTASLTIWATGLTGQITLLGENGIRQTIYVDKLDGTNQTVLYNKADQQSERFPSFEGDTVTYDDLFPGKAAAPKRTTGEKATGNRIPSEEEKEEEDDVDDVNDDNIYNKYGNSGKENSGKENSGKENSGQENSGKENSGKENSGEENSGEENSGEENSGEENSREENSGEENSGEAENAVESGTSSEGTDPAGAPKTESLKGPGLRLMIVDEETARENQPAGNFTKRRTRSRTVLRVNKNCKVAIVADNTFVARFGDKTVKQMVSIMADVREIYERNFGVGLTIGAVYVDRKDNLKLRNNGNGRIGTVSGVLKSFTSAVSRGQIELGDDICIAHLFTSRTFGATLGVAFVGSPDRDVRGGICSSSSNTGVSTHIGSRGTALPVSAWVATVAHELGHGFGASHDESTPCAGEREIMAAAVRSDGPPVDDFSVCSMNAIRKVMQTKATCLI